MRPRHQVAAMASTSDARICDECLELCNEIVDEELRGEPGPDLDADRHRRRQCICAASGDLDTTNLKRR